MEDNNSTNEVLCPTCSTPVDPDLLIPAGDSKICPNCREEYQQRILEGVDVNRSDDFATIRQEHIKHEASIRSVGLLYYLFGAMAVLGAISMTFTFTTLSNDSDGMLSFMWIILVIYLAIGGVLIVTARGLRELKRWARIPATILSALGLISFPIGTLINGYILYLIWSHKGKTIFTPEYREVIEATPEIKYRTSTLSWIILILLVVGLVAAVVMASMG